MILIYLVLWCVGAFLVWQAHQRVRSAEGKYTALNTSYLQLVAKLPKGKLDNPFESVQSAVSLLELARLDERRCQLEGRYTKWQERYEGLKGLLSRLTGWRGKAFPYLVGIVDSATALAVLEVMGLIDQVRWSVVVTVLRNVAIHFGWL